MRRMISVLLTALLLAVVPGSAIAENGRLELSLNEGFSATWEEDTMCSQVVWDELYVDESTAEEVPALAAALDMMSGMQEQRALELAEELYVLRMETFGEASSAECFVGMFRYFVQRADEAVLSVWQYEEVERNDYFPERRMRGINLDPETGRELQLTDVVNDVPKLYGLLAYRVAEKYPSESIVDIEATLENQQPEWTLGYDGIAFCVGPWFDSSNDVDCVVKVPFDGLSDLLHERYIPEPNPAYAVLLPVGTEIEVDIAAGDGRTEVVSFEAFSDAYYEDTYRMFTVEFNGKSLTKRGWAYAVSPYLVVCGDDGARKAYLYLETVSDNDYTTLYVFDLNAKIPRLAGELSGYGFGSMLNNPMDFLLTRHVEILGTRFITQSYSIDENTGMPIPQEDYCAIAGYSTLVSLIPIKAQMLDTGKMETIPAGTEFCEFGTDGETYMDFILNDGRECRIQIDTSDYPAVIDGVPEYECFDGIVYAG